MANLLNLRWVRFTTVRHASGHIQGQPKLILAHAHGHARGRAEEADGRINQGTGIPATALRLQARQLHGQTQLMPHQEALTCNGWVTSFRRAGTRE